VAWNAVVVVGGLWITWFGSPLPVVPREVPLWAIVLLGLAVGTVLGHVAVRRAQAPGEARLAKICLVADYVLVAVFVLAIIALIIWVASWFEGWAEWD